MIFFAIYDHVQKLLYDIIIFCILIPVVKFCSLLDIFYTIQDSHLTTYNIYSQKDKYSEVN